MTIRVKKAARRPKPTGAPGKSAPLPSSVIAAQLDKICTLQGRIHGELVGALVRRAISPTLLVKQVEQVEQMAAQLRTLLNTLTKGA